MEQSAIIAQLTPIFRKTFNNENLMLNKDLSADDVDSWDSLSHMLMIGQVEDSFALKFKLKELRKLENVGGLVELIQYKIAQ